MRHASTLVLLLLVGVAAFWLGRHPRPTPELDAKALLREVQRGNELVTVKYTVQKIVGLREPRPLLAEESILLVVQARVLGGVDLGSLTEGDLLVSPGGAVRVRLPQAKIIEVAVDENATKVWDRRTSWWAPWTPFDKDFERRARMSALDEIRVSAVEMGVLRDARQSAQTWIERLLKAAGISAVTFHAASS